MTNSLNFCWSEKVFLSPSLWKDNFAEYKILGWLFLLLLFFLAYMVFEEKSDLIIILVPLQVRCLFPLAFFKFFSLSLIFCSFNIIYLCIDVLEFACIMFSELAGFVVWCLSSNFSAITTSNISSFPFSISSPFSITCISDLL